MSDLPYQTIPQPPATVSGGAVLSRLADGVGFRLRWASEGLGEADLAFRPAPDCMSLGELLEHVHGLLRWVGECLGLDRSAAWMRRAEGIGARQAALLTAQALAARFAALPDEQLEAVSVKPSGGEVYPFWNLVNGPMSDTLTHVGQIASWRRIAGKPVPGADVFRGRPPRLDQK
jgi:hypothetical protein